LTTKSLQTNDSKRIPVDFGRLLQAGSYTILNVGIHFKKCSGWLHIPEDLTIVQDLKGYLKD